MIIRQAGIGDLEGIAEIEVLSFATPWSKEAFKTELVSEGRHYVVAEEAGRVVGYGGFWSILDEGHITNIAVHPEHRHKGIGIKLIENMLAVGKNIGLERFTLEVRVSNESAVRLYEKAGFVSAGKRPGYYSNPREAALIMWKEMNNSL